MTFSDLALAAWACGDVIVWEFETFAFGGAVKGLGSQASMRLPLDAIVVLLVAWRVGKWMWWVDGGGVSKCGGVVELDAEIVDPNVEMMSGVIFLKWSTRDVGRYIYTSMGENGAVAYRIII